MSEEGARLVECFRKLGCPNATSLTGVDFDYLFENPDVAFFLKTFCQKVETGELVTLTDEEAERLEYLESSGQMLEGDLLDKAILASGSEGATSEEVPETESYLEEDVANLKTYKKELLNSYKLLEAQKSKLNSETAVLQKKLPQLERDCVRLQGLCEKDRHELAEILKKLAKSLGKIFEIQEENRASNEDATTGFLSRLDLGEYLGSEEKFLLEIKKYTQATFIKGEGDASCASGNEAGSMQIFEVASWKKDYTELHECLKESHNRTLLAAASEKGRKRQLELLRERLSDTRETSCLELQEKLNELEKASEAVDREMSNILTDSLSDAGSSYATECLAKIVEANYHLKKEKQKYLLERQQQLLEIVTMQESRLRFVMTMLQLESEQHRQLNRILDDIQLAVERDTRSLRTREEMLQKLKEEQDSISDESSLDATSQSLAAILGNSNVPPAGYRELAEVAAAARHKLDGHLAALPRRFREREQRLARMESNFKEMEDSLSSDSPVSVETNESLEVLKRKVQVMEQMLGDMVREFKTKKEILASNPAEIWRRECFVRYLTDGERSAATEKSVDTG